METRKLLDLAVRPRVVLILLVVLAIVGFLIGSIGGSAGGSTTTSVNATVTPKDIGLAPGQSRPFTVVVKNPNDYGARVASIGASSSEAVGGCPAGLLTSEEVSNPTGFIRPHGVNAYAITLKLADHVDDRCLGQSFTLPLTVELQSART